MTLYDAFRRLQLGHIIIEVAILFPYLTSATFGSDFWSQSEQNSAHILEEFCGLLISRSEATKSSILHISASVLGKADEQWILNDCEQNSDQKSTVSIYGRLKVRYINIS